MMERENFFEKIGKRVPYEVPDGFFDSITEKTLQNAKERKSWAKRRYIMIWTSAAAAVLALLAISVLYMHQSDKRGIPETFVQREENSEVLMPEEKLIPIPDSSLYYDMVPRENELLAQSEENQGNGEEAFQYLIASLTEDELLLLAGQISAELYINSIIED
jgi:hypothetical protein